MHAYSRDRRNPDKELSWTEKLLSTFRKPQKQEEPKEQKFLFVIK